MTLQDMAVAAFNEKQQQQAARETARTQRVWPAFASRLGISPVLAEGAINGRQISLGNGITLERGELITLTTAHWYILDGVERREVSSMADIGAIFATE